MKLHALNILDAKKRTSAKTCKNYQIIKRTNECANIKESRNSRGS